MVKRESVEDILDFPKSPRLSPKDENWESYELHKLGNFEEFQEVHLEQNCIFRPMGLLFRLQACL